MHPDIRRATDQDAGWIADIWNGIIVDTLVTFTTTPKSPSEVRDLIANRPVFMLPARAGFATYGPFRSGPGYAATAEHTIYLAPDQTGQGLGAALMDHVISHAAYNGFRALVAGVSSANPGAIRFHARHGFTQVGHMPQVGHKAGQWLDLILMQKMLNPPDTPNAGG
ncbi:GNAT family N-acetyltransferase [uncultured Tateyamaria sp.]|uniref:GNAT family N-acetyltransferase n=1 Tax=Tateyamaria sp. 1078 TaxID=3417464 RepID=UPI0026194015|nr:GNAT family N-acetyltransferase [uncultured Tateyamaria sp.]